MKPVRVFGSARTGRHERPAVAGSHLVRDISAAVLGATATALPVFLVGTLAVQMRPSLHLTLGSFGAAISFYFLAAALGSIPAGRLVERLGSARMMRAAAIAAALALVLLALLARSFSTLVALMLVAGLLSSFMQPATNRFLIRRIPDPRQGLAFGIKQAAVPFSAFLGGLAVPVVALTIGWRWAFVMAAGVAGAAALLVPRRPGGRAAGQPTIRGGERAELAALIVLAIGFGLGVLATTGLTAFLVISAVASGIGRAPAGLVAALAGATSVVARVVVGMRADRRGRAHLIVVALMLTVGMGGYLILAAGSATRAAPLFVVGAVVAYGAGWGWNGLFNFAIARSHADAPAKATSITQTGGRLAGVVGPIVFSLVVTHSSYAVAWIMAAGSALAGAVVILIGRRVLRSTRRGAESAMAAIQAEATRVG